MRVRAAPFWTQKLGNRQSEYEDACWPESRLDQESDCVRFAVADGATELQTPEQKESARRDGGGGVNG
jgi:hypothetical protein